MARPNVAIQKIHNRLIKKFDDLNGKVVLDYGCGRGWALPALLNEVGFAGRVIGVDSSEKLLECAKNNLESFIESNLLELRVCYSPDELRDKSYNNILCHNVLECVKDKIEMINSFYSLLKKEGTLILSHHDFDSALYNSSYKNLTRQVIHHFSDTKADWQEYADGQMGRKLPGLFNQSFFKNFKCETWRLVEYFYNPDTYGYLLGQGLIETGKSIFSENELNDWALGLEYLAKNKNYYFAIDVVVIKATKN